MKLGQEVLTKIENLLTRMDQKVPRPPPSRTINRQHQFDAQIFIKLHREYREKLNKIQQKQAEKQNLEMSKLSPFKVTNKHSIFLNSQLKHQPPLYQRLKEVQKQKNEELIKLRQKYPKTQQKALQLEAEQKGMQGRRKNEKKYSQREMEEKIYGLQLKENQRQGRLNTLRVRVIEDYSKDFRCKPYVNRESNLLWKTLKLKKQLSSSVFQRFQHYQMKRKTHLQQTERKYRNQLTPFNPKISQTSRLLASRCASKQKLHKPATRSVSCKCLQRSKSQKQNTSTALHSSRIF